MFSYRSSFAVYVWRYGAAPMWRESRCYALSSVRRPAVDIFIAMEGGLWVLVHSCAKHGRTCSCFLLPVLSVESGSISSPVCASCHVAINPPTHPSYRLKEKMACAVPSVRELRYGRFWSRWSLFRQAWACMQRCCKNSCRMSWRSMKPQPIGHTQQPHLRGPDVFGY